MCSRLEWKEEACELVLFSFGSVLDVEFQPFGQFSTFPTEFAIPFGMADS
jgi:hypothetical protein